MSRGCGTGTAPGTGTGKDPGGGKTGLAKRLEGDPGPGNGSANGFLPSCKSEVRLSPESYMAKIKHGRIIIDRQIDYGVER